MAIPIRSRAELDAMRRAGEGARRVLEACLAACRPGVTTGELDAVAEEEIERLGATSVRGTTSSSAASPFPGHICVNVNEEAAHAVPGERILRDGDLVSVDVAVEVGGWWADMAEPVVVGASPAGSRESRLRDAARRVTGAVLEILGPGVSWRDGVAGARDEAATLGVRLVEGLDGHGIGRLLHEAPSLSHGASAAEILFRPGMVVTVEPTVTDGGGRTVGADDGWTLLAVDRGRVCFRERTVAITRSGIEILTPDPADA